MFLKDRSQNKVLCLKISIEWVTAVIHQLINEKQKENSNSRGRGLVSTKTWHMRAGQIYIQNQSIGFQGAWGRDHTCRGRWWSPHIQSCLCSYRIWTYHIGNRVFSKVITQNIIKVKIILKENPSVRVMHVRFWGGKYKQNK